MEKLVMGIDPGTNFMGYAIIRTTGKNSRPELIVSGVVDMKKIEDPYLKLQRIFQRTLQVIDSYQPDELAIESQFYGKNIQSMLKLGRAQGVAIAAALQRNIPIFEYAPKKIKMSITGTGEASKEQIALLLGKFMVMPDTISTLDETDAIAIAYCHHLQGTLPTTGGSKCKDWGDFIKQNPDKIV
ncbi:crossover junction endodeoxyribonuclease RuvC [uncultured Sanguibacteroides sp.]|uniref:crossover junction endodeoxyribonuclease RuvC n=1 Tax=uncultured Sanguibacteroides sp. TaxID=1635151 RepID=UPI0025F5D1FC|nr:crossover junction endodeoxyribonuclease RuvC [uncultured Sanguibacteroides sp.]